MGGTVMNINDLTKKNPEALLIVSAADLKEFALSVFDERMKAREDEEKLYTPKEFALRWQTSITSLNRWCANGLLHKTIVGGKVFYKDSDLKKVVR